MLAPQKFFYEIASAKMSAKASAGGKTVFLGKKEQQAAGLSQKQVNSRLSKAKTPEAKVAVINDIKNQAVVNQSKALNSEPAKAKNTTPAKKAASPNKKTPAKPSATPKKASKPSKEPTVQSLKKKSANKNLNDMELADMLSLEKEIASARAKFGNDSPKTKNTIKAVREEQRDIRRFANDRAFQKVLDATFDD